MLSFSTEQAEDKMFTREVVLTLDALLLTLHALCGYLDTSTVAVGGSVSLWMPKIRRS